MSDASRHPDHERVKARLVRAWQKGISSADAFDDVAAEAIAMGARAPDPREELVEKVMKIMLRPVAPGHSGEGFYHSRSEEIVNYVLDHAPNEG